MLENPELGFQIVPLARDNDNFTVELRKDFPSLSPYHVFKLHNIPAAEKYSHHTQCFAVYLSLLSSEEWWPWETPMHSICYR